MKTTKKTDPISVIPVENPGGQNTADIAGETYEAILQTAQVQIDKIDTRYRPSLVVRCGLVWTMPKLPGQSIAYLDFDGAASINYNQIRDRLHLCGLRPVWIQSKRSPGGKGYHVACGLDGHLTRFQLTAIQAICESDPYREAKNFARALMCKTDAEWLPFNVLFTASKKGVVKNG